ncbi:hypothetical protein KIN20_032896 [Parelaphostrongylus tenuis]|uniref:Uncharacterized protein n=1 Tax=Parelaphostrongylus tenuis TaxID=148309 RepID=A0AAD5R7P1_PARTN|nr:hypothetical protein KIN20_032896 [Parelaphostrongylus tenuis]
MLPRGSARVPDESGDRDDKSFKQGTTADVRKNESAADRECQRHYFSCDLVEMIASCLDEVLLAVLSGYNWANENPPHSVEKKFP